MELENRCPYKKDIEKLNNSIRKLKNTCLHENAISEPGANTGNYDLYESYWVTVECPDCGLYKTYDSEKNPREYIKFCDRKYYRKELHEDDK